MGINAQDIPFEILQKTLYLELNFKNIIFESIPSGYTIGLVCGNTFSEKYLGIYGIPKPSDPVPPINLSVSTPFTGQGIYESD